MILKQLSIFLENKSGRLTEVSQTLAEAEINISAMSIADTAEYGILRLLVSNPVKASKILKEKGFSVNVTPVIAIIMPHHPGGLARALQILSDAEISIEYIYAFAYTEDKATVVIRTDTPEEAIKALQTHKMELLHESDIYEI